MDFEELAKKVKFAEINQSLNSRMTFEEDIQRAVAALRRGGVILYPTDTVWGIGCDATDSAAVRRVFEIKHRADSKALITLVADVADIGRFTSAPSHLAVELMAQSDRPVTVVYPGGRDLAPELLGSDGTVGMRVTSEKVSASLCRAFGKPIVSTSANISGQPAATLFADIDSGIIDSVDYAMESRRADTRVAMPSRIVKINPDGTVTVLRP